MSDEVRRIGTEKIAYNYKPGTFTLALERQFGPLRVDLSVAEARELHQILDMVLPELEEMTNDEAK